MPDIPSVRRPLDLDRLRRLGATSAPLCAVRSALSASIAYSLALLLGLQQPLWAPVSALITARDSWGDTFAECRSRILGTVVGTLLAILGSIVLRPFALSPVVNLALVTGATAAIVSFRPEWRVGLWTASITLLSQAPDTGIWGTGLARFCEVALGAIVATLVSAAEFQLVRRWIAGRR
ncbi:FUSC family protein [Sphingomonas sp. OTU376]|uniref:FUSC family protein n=1 Tax=Sphingomonas sp. OTU376 TaxID=3043863 RepID=UPI00313BFCDD